MWDVFLVEQPLEEVQVWLITVFSRLVYVRYERSSAAHAIEVVSYGMAECHRVLDVQISFVGFVGSILIHNAIYVH
jgi:hypothetical protein